MTPADQPSPRLDENSRLAHRELLEKRHAGHIDVYFVGDSITRRWGTADLKYAHLLANWRKNFQGWNAADFGWGADTTQNILWRLEEGELDGVDPKVIVIMAGTNNVGAMTLSAEDAHIAQITRGIQAIVAAGLSNLGGRLNANPHGVPGTTRQHRSCSPTLVRSQHSVARGRAVARNVAQR